MGSVVEMRSLRATLLALVATLVLLGGFASSVYADDGGAAGPGATTTDASPSDPGIPE
jgi:hypothetical protein